MLENYIKNKLNEKKILLMTHIVIGYPTLEESYRIVKTMVEAGVDLMELQIPFSEPIADGPVILHANQVSLAGNISVEQCLEFGKRVAVDFGIPFLFMSYYNILFKHGVEAFTGAMAKGNIRGAIVPDLPLEEGTGYLEAMNRYGLDPIFIFSPTTTDERMKLIASRASGFVYCVARKGVTGLDTSFSRQLETYLARCRNATDLPLALGFGVKDKADVDFLSGKADIAVIGTQTIRIIDEKGIPSAGDFIRGLR
ncbi:MAG: tryptophan synthase subunit alpha [Spirochaetales bacterium]|nr:tryptophan synthase subunit alpha [Spirochaetales bacterium]